MSPLLKTVIISTLALAVFAGAVAATALTRSGGDAPAADPPLAEVQHEPASATPVSTLETATPAPTSPATSTPDPDRADCSQIRGTAYASEAERLWFLTNCLEPIQPVAFQQPPPAPATPLAETTGAAAGFSSAEAAGVAVDWWSGSAAARGYTASASSCGSEQDGSQWTVRCQAELVGCQRQDICQLTFTVCLIEAPRTVWAC